jgi:hypothetical protein
MTVTAVSFESGLTLHSHHCASCKITHDRILGSHAAHLQVSKTFGIISGDVNLPFSETAWNMKLLFCLIDETHSSPVTRTCKWSLGLFLRVSGTTSLHQASPRLNQVHCTLDICKYTESGSGNCHRYCFSHSCPLTHSVSLVHHKLQVKITTRNTQLRWYFMVCGLCSVGITAWDKLGIQGWAPLSKPVGSGLGWISWAEIGPICMFPCYIGSSGWKSQRGQDLEEKGASWRTVMIMVAYYKTWYLMDWLNWSYSTFISSHTLVYLLMYKIHFYTLILLPL